MADSDPTPGKSPAFQFYPKDFVSDSHVIAMRLDERGAYITLLCACWMDGSLPPELSALARMCRVSTATFTRLWPALEPCFRVVTGRLIQPRIERERQKQETWRAMKSAAGKQGGRPKAQLKQKLSRSQAKQSPPSSSSSSSPISDLLPSGEKTAPPTDARSGRPIFKGQRFVVFEWMLDDLRKLLGSHSEDFDLHAWFFTLDAKVAKAAIVLPQRDGGRWLQDQTLAEAARRGLTIAAVQPWTGKTAGNAAAIARFIARGQA